MLGMVKVRYHKYPYLIHDMAIRHTRYNRTLDFLEKEEKRGNVFIIRPQQKSAVGRVERIKRNWSHYMKRAITMRKLLMMQCGHI